MWGEILLVTFSSRCRTLPVSLRPAAALFRA
jgi:hypothetical protein